MNIKVRTALKTLIVIVLASLMVVTGVTIFSRLRKKDNKPNTNPLEWSIDTWDGSSISSKEYLSDFGGRGDKSITIESANSFLYFIEQVNSGNSYDGYTIYLNSNLDLAGYTIDSIGNSEGAFEGTFDGGYYTIMNANINGAGLFGRTLNAEIKNIGLYNVNINSSERYTGGLIGRAYNTSIENSFIRLGSVNGAEYVGGLVGLYEHEYTLTHVKNSFADTSLTGTNVYGLFGKATSGEVGEGLITLEDIYFTGAEAGYEALSSNYVLSNVMKATSLNQFNNWSYAKDDSEKWANYSYVEGTTKYSFKYPILKEFAKVYTLGACYENVLYNPTTGKVENLTSLTEAIESADGLKDATINIIVDKITIDKAPELKNRTNITINAVKDTVITRGENNDSALLSVNNKGVITLGDANSSAKIILDGNRENVEKNKLKSGALLEVSNLVINQNVVLQNNINNQGNGGAIVVPEIGYVKLTGMEIKNCEAKKGGAVYIEETEIQPVSIGTKEIIIDETVNITGCTAEMGGAIYVTGKANLTIADNVYGNNAEKGKDIYFEDKSTITLTKELINNLSIYMENLKGYEDTGRTNFIKTTVATGVELGKNVNKLELENEELQLTDQLAPNYISAYKGTEYTITYNADGGTHTNPESYTCVDKVELASATKEGYTFKGWKEVKQTALTVSSTDEDYATTITPGTLGNKEYLAEYGDDSVTGTVYFHIWAGDEFINISDDSKIFSHNYIYDNGGIDSVTGEETYGEYSDEIIYVYYELLNNKLLDRIECVNVTGSHGSCVEVGFRASTPAEVFISCQELRWLIGAADLTGQVDVYFKLYTKDRPDPDYVDIIITESTSSWRAWISSITAKVSGTSYTRGEYVSLVIEDWNRVDNINISMTIDCFTNEFSSVLIYNGYYDQRNINGGDLIYLETDTPPLVDGKTNVYELEFTLSGTDLATLTNDDALIVLEVVCFGTDSEDKSFSMVTNSVLENGSSKNSATTWYYWDGDIGSETWIEGNTIKDNCASMKVKISNYQVPAGHTFEKLQWRYQVYTEGGFSAWTDLYVGGQYQNGTDLQDGVNFSYTGSDIYVDFASSKVVSLLPSGSAGYTYDIKIDFNFVTIHATYAITKNSNRYDYNANAFNSVSFKMYNLDTGEEVETLTTIPINGIRLELSYELKPGYFLTDEELVCAGNNSSSQGQGWGVPGHNPTSEVLYNRELLCLVNDDYNYIDVWFELRADTSITSKTLILTYSNPGSYGQNFTFNIDSGYDLSEDKLTLTKTWADGTISSDLTVNYEATVGNAMYAADRVQFGAIWGDSLTATKFTKTTLESLFANSATVELAVSIYIVQNPNLLEYTYISTGAYSVKFTTDSTYEAARQQLTKLDIPTTHDDGTNGEHNVTVIAENGFAGFTALTEVKLPDTIVEIGAGAFKNCPALTGFIIPSGVTEIKAETFMVESSPTGFSSIVIPASVESIGDKAFYGRTSLTSVTFTGSNLTFIGSYVFYCCQIRSLTLPASITTLSDYALSDMWSLQTLNLSNTNITELPEQAISNASSLTNLWLPSKLETIGNYAFRNTSSLTSLTIPTSVRSIGLDLFYMQHGGSSAISSVSFADPYNWKVGSTYIDALTKTPTNATYLTSTYAGSAWTKDVAPSYLTYTAIGSTAWEVSLKSGSTQKVIQVPNGYNGKPITKIKASGFIGKGITSITIPNTVTTIGDYAFADCTALTGITLPTSCTTVGVQAFRNCSSLETAIMNNVTTLGMGAFCLTSGKEGCKSLSDVRLNSIETIGDGAFENCAALKIITLPNTLKTIGQYAFRYSGLTSINIPSSVTEIGDSAFATCESLATITSNNATYKSYDNRMLYTDTSIMQYAVANSATSLDWSTFGAKTTITAIAPQAFRGAGKLQTVNLSGFNGLVTIGESAFNVCTALKTVYFPNNLESIGANAFYGCTAVIEIKYYASNITTLGVDCFKNLGKNGAGITVNIYDSVSSIPNDMFYRASDGPKIASINFTNATGLSSIGKNAFKGCTSLTTITGFDNTAVSQIGQSAFEGCSNLTSAIEFSENLSVIEANAFKGTGVSSFTFDTNAEIPWNVYNENTVVKSYDSPAEINNDGANVTAYLTDNGYKFEAASYFVYELLANNTYKVSIDPNKKNSLPDTLIILATHEGKSITQVGDFTGITVDKLSLGTNIISVTDGAFAGSTIGELVINSQSGLQIGYESFIVIAEERASRNFQEIFDDSTYSGVEYYHLITSRAKIKSFSGGAKENGIKVFTNALGEGVALYNTSSKTLIYYASEATYDEFVLPNEVEHIGDWAFAGNTTLALLDISNNSMLKTIGYGAFHRSRIKSVTIPKLVTTIGNYAFYECRYLEEINYNAIQANDFTSGNYVFMWAGWSTSSMVVNFGKEVQRVPSYLFYSYGGTEGGYAEVHSNSSHGRPRITAINFAKNCAIAEIGACSFRYLNQIHGTIDLSELGQLVSIGDWAFRGCVNLTGVTFPDTICTIGRYAFGWNNRYFDSVSFGLNLNYIGKGAFIDVMYGYDPDAESQSLYPLAWAEFAEIDGWIVTKNTLANGTHVTLEEGESSANANLLTSTYVGHDWYKNLDWYDFRLVTLDKTTGETLTDAQAQNNPNAVTGWSISVKDGFDTNTIPDDVTEVVVPARYHDATLGEYNVIQLGYFGWFGLGYPVDGRGGENITSIKLPHTLLTIDADAFTHTRLGSLEVPDCVVRIDNDAFWEAQIGKITLGSGVRYISGAAFEHNYVVNSVEVSEDNNYFSSIDGVLFNKNKTELVYCPSQLNTTKYDIPDSVLEIGAYAFYNFGINYDHETESINGYRDINIIFGAGVNKIQKYAFYTDVPITCNGGTWYTLTSTEYDTQGYTGGTQVTGDLASTIAYEYRMYYYRVTDPNIFGITAEGYIYLADESKRATLDYLNIPATLNGKNVVGIADNGFENMTNLKIVTYDNLDAITYIGNYAFSGCGNLQVIDIGENVEYLGTAFINCTGVETLNYYAKNLIPVADRVFENLGQESSGVILNIGPKVEIISNIACISSFSVKITQINWMERDTENPAEVEIDCGAFQGLINLKELTIPKYVSKIGEYAFFNCESLETINFYAEDCEVMSNAFALKETTTTDVTVNFSVKKVPAYMFNATKAQYRPLNVTTINFDVNVPVEEIGENAFSNCSGLTSISEWKYLKTIGDNAFNGCTGLTEITIPENVTSIGKKAFYGTTNVKTLNYNAVNCAGFVNGNSPFGKMGSGNTTTRLNVGADVTIIPAYIFGHTSSSNEAASIEIVNFAENNRLEKIGAYAFRYTMRHSGASINLENCNNLTEIGEAAFKGCTLLSSITIPENVTTIDSDAFAYLNGLQNLYFNAKNVTTIGTNIFRRDLNQVDLTLTIGKDVTNIIDSCFMSLKNVPNLTINWEADGVKDLHIGANAFNGLTNVTSLTIPERTKSIATGAFSGMKNVSELYFNATNMNDINYTSSESSDPIGNKIFNGLGYNVATAVTFGENVGKIPAGLFFATTIEDYRPNINSITFTNNCPNLNTFNGFGDWAFAYTNISSEVDLSGLAITRLGNNAFNHSSIKEILLPSTLTNIGTRVFEYSDLTTINLGDIAIQRINPRAFANCELTEVTIPASLNFMGYGVFENCANLATINWSVIYAEGDSDPDLSDGFAHNIKDLVQPSGPLKIFNGVGRSVEDGVTFNVVNPESGVVTLIPANLFNGSTINLTTVNLADVTYIGAYAFAGISSATFEMNFGSWDYYTDDTMMSTKAISASNVNTILTGDDSQYTWKYNTELNDFIYDQIGEKQEYSVRASTILEGKSGEITLNIPSEFDGWPVTTIYADAFTGMSGTITNLYIPTSITYIEAGAFGDITNVLPVDSKEKIFENTDGWYYIAKGNEATAELADWTLLNADDVEATFKTNYANYSFKKMNTVLTVNLYDDTTLKQTVYYDKADSKWYSDVEKINEITEVERMANTYDEDGNWYIHVGYEYDGIMVIDHKMDFVDNLTLFNSVSGSVDLTAIWTKISVEEITFDCDDKTYNSGNEILVTFNVSSTNLDNSINFEYYYIQVNSGTEKSFDNTSTARKFIYSTTNTASNGFKAGKNRLSVVFFLERGDYKARFGWHFNLKLGKAVVAKPTVSTEEFTYDGAEKRLIFTGFDDTIMEIDSTKDIAQTNVGSYTTVVKLKDNNNYCWENGTEDENTNGLEFSWSIVNNKLSDPQPENVEIAYTGSAINVADYITIDGKLLSSSDWTGKLSYTGNTATDVGEYTLTITITATGYCWSDDGLVKTIKWNIVARGINKPTLKNGDIRIEYTGSEIDLTDYIDDYFDGYNSSSMTIGGTTTATDPGTYIVTFTPKEGYEWDGATGDCSFNWTIYGFKVTLAGNTAGYTYGYDGASTEDENEVNDYWYTAGKRTISYSPYDFFELYYYTVTKNSDNSVLQKTYITEDMINSHKFTFNEVSYETIGDEGITISVEFVSTFTVNFKVETEDGLSLSSNANLLAGVVAYPDGIGEGKTRVELPVVYSTQNGTDGIIGKATIMNLSNLIFAINGKIVDDSIDNYYDVISKVELKDGNTILNNLLEFTGAVTDVGSEGVAASYTITDTGLFSAGGSYDLVYTLVRMVSTENFVPENTTDTNIEITPNSSDSITVNNKTYITPGAEISVKVGVISADYTFIGFLKTEDGTTNLIPYNNIGDLGIYHAESINATGKYEYTDFVFSENVSVVVLKNFDTTNISVSLPNISLIMTHETGLKYNLTNTDSTKPEVADGKFFHGSYTLTGLGIENVEVVIIDDEGNIIETLTSVNDEIEITIDDTVTSIEIRTTVSS